MWIFFCEQSNQVGKDAISRCVRKKLFGTLDKEENLGQRLIRKGRENKDSRGNSDDFSKSRAVF